MTLFWRVTIDSVRRAVALYVEPLTRGWAAWREAREDRIDIKAARTAMDEPGPRIPWEDVKKTLDL